MASFLSPQKATEWECIDQAVTPGRAKSPGGSLLASKRNATPQRCRFGTPTRTPNRASSCGRAVSTPSDLNIAKSEESDNWSLNSFAMSKPLGRGKFGNVYQAKQKVSGVSVALKVLFKAQMTEEQSVRMLRREVEIQYRLRNENILSLYGCFQDTKNVYLILEYAEGGEYSKYLAQHSTEMTEEVCRRHLMQVASGLHYLHTRYVMHRDLKPENILLDRDGNLKLADFGSAVHGPNTMEGHHRRYTMCGTPEYLSPEVIRCGGHDLSVDIWAFGILAFEIMFKRTPFAENTAVSQAHQHADQVESVTTPVNSAGVPKTKKRTRDDASNDDAEVDKEAQQRKILYHRILSYRDNSLFFEFANNFLQRFWPGQTQQFVQQQLVSSQYRVLVLRLIRSEARDRPTSAEVLELLRSQARQAPAISSTLPLASS